VLHFVVCSLSLSLHFTALLLIEIEDDWLRKCFWELLKRNHVIGKHKNMHLIVLAASFCSKLEVEDDRF
jgi:hypothetical protein